MSVEAPTSCPHGCEDGWHYDWDTNTASSCACRVPAAKARKQQADAGRRYARARRAGKASAAARAARRPSRARKRGNCPRPGFSPYHVRDVSRAEFEIGYRDMCGRQGLVFSARGMNTCWALYEVERRSWHAQGQDFETTNGQRQVALEARGRGRCRRTVQYTRKRLGWMGLVAYFHVRRGGATPGEKDTLRVRMLRTRSIRRANCTPPFGEAGNRLVPRRGSPASNDLIPPTSSADEDPAPPGGPASPAGTERETAGVVQPAPATPGELIAPPLEAAGELIALPGLEEDDRMRQRRFDEMKRRAGWIVPRRSSPPPRFRRRSTDGGGHA